MMNKKAISTVVATVLIVLITVAAVTILWVAIAPLIERDPGVGIACFNVQRALSIDNNRLYTCYDNDVGVRVERAANTPELQGLELFVDIDGTTADGIIETNLPTQGGARIYDLTTVDTSTASRVRVAVAPRILVEGAITSCDPGYYIEINECA